VTSGTGSTTPRSRYRRGVENPIVFWPTEQDETNLEVLEAAGLSGEAAIRLAIASLAAECAPVAWALANSDATADA